MKPFIRKITLEVLENSLPQGVVLNVNFPKLTKDISKESKYAVRQKPLMKNLTNDKHHKQRLYWYRRVCKSEGEDTDEWALVTGTFL
jgi:5'-nucleotidase